jgi:EAL domain-containing protein (putative c-di-GMP-specific phosphodiesterase class I)
VIALAKAMGLDVTAEGIETGEQLQFLTNKRCERGQGFHLAKPMNSTDFVALVEELRQRRSSAPDEGMK